jgi:membrane fusion protein, heavy metal efflux system
MSPPSSKQGNFSVRSLLCNLALALPLLAAGDGWANEVVKLTATQIKSAGVTVATVQPASAHAMTGNSLRLSGHVAIPNRGIDMVSATAAGQVQALLVNVGETVRTGTPLARLYSPDLLSLQRAYLQARSDAELSSQKLKRDEALFADGIIAQSRVEETRIAHTQAQANLTEQRQMLKLAGMSETSIGKLTSAIDINPVQIISARVGGIVLEQSVTPGERIEPGAALFKVGDTRTLWMELQATQAQFNQLQVGNKVAIEGCNQSGHIIAISPQVNTNSQTALVRAEFANAGKCLHPNQFVEVEVTTQGGGGSSGSSHKVVSIPAKALLRSGGKDYVFVQDDNGFRMQEVAVQSRQSDVVWVSDSLPAGTKIAVSGITALRGAASGLGQE